MIVHFDSKLRRPDGPPTALLKRTRHWRRVQSGRKRLQGKLIRGGLVCRHGHTERETDWAALLISGAARRVWNGPFIRVEITALGAGPQTPKVGYVRNPLGYSEKVRTAMGRQICAGGSARRRLEASLNNNSFPLPPRPKEKPAASTRRARNLYRPAGASAGPKPRARMSSLPSGHF